MSQDKESAAYYESLYQQTLERIKALDWTIELVTAEKNRLQIEAKHLMKLRVVEDKEQ